MHTLSSPARRFFGSFLVAAAVVLVAAAPTAGAGPTTWHRLNPSDPPEHERYSCRAGDVWHCRYDKLPERDLGFAWNQTRGVFTGSATSFTCPDWFSTAPCDAADTVITGVGTFWTFDNSLRPTGSFSVDQQLLAADDGTLWVDWGRPVRVPVVSDVRAGPGVGSVVRVRS
jgi:hypothetical protein